MSDNPEWIEPADLTPYIKRTLDNVRFRGTFTWTYVDTSYYDAFVADPTVPILTLDGECAGIVTNPRRTGPGEWTFDLLPDPFRGDAANPEEP